MIGVKQITSVSCFLACLESFLKDCGIQIDQKCMIQIIQNKGFSDANGFVPFPLENMIKACNILNLNISEIPYHYPIDKKYADGSLLIGTIKPEFHCRRFIDQIENEKILVMDPATGLEFYWDKSLMENQQPVFYKIEIL
jgi:hypothetical protein